MREYTAMIVKNSLKLHRKGMAMKFPRNAIYLALNPAYTQCESALLHSQLKP